MEQQQNKKKFNFWWLLVAGVALILLVQLTMNLGKSNVESISLSKFQELVGVHYDVDEAKYVVNLNGTDPVPCQIWGVYKESNTYYLITTEKAQKLDYKLTATEKDNLGYVGTLVKNPEKIKDYASYTLYDSYGTVAEILQARDGALTVVSSGAVPTSWTEWIIPIIYIVLTLGVLFVLWRGMSGRNGISAMTQNRATVVFNGPTRFTDVAGIDEEREQVAEIVDFLRSPKKYVEMGARIPKGVLLIGQPGTGKTLLAKAIAGEAGVPFFSLSGSDFSEMLVGVGPARMRDLFEQAKAHAPAIIFLDELDSIARMRGVGASGVAEENEQTLNQLLVQMDGFSKSEGVIVLAATNRPDVLDPAILRPGRFDRQIVVQMPDVKGREQILKVHARNKPLGNVDLNRVAKITSGFTGADLENLLNESAIIAAKDNRNRITMPDVIEGINKVMMGPQKKSRILTEEDQKITAFHESGHAIISKILLPDQTVQEVSIIPRGMAAGYTLTNDQDHEHNHQSFRELKNRLVMLLGGRTAEELFIGDICTGASNDIKVATDLAEKMVTKWGMSAKLGPLYYGKEDEAALRIYNHKQLSESVQATIDNEIRALINDAQAECRKILTANAAKVKVMAAVLLENETIYADDIALIMDGKSAQAVNQNITDKEKNATQAANDERVTALLAQLNPLLDRAMQIAKLHLEENLVTAEHLQKLARNCELARDYVRVKHQMPPVLPTIDPQSLDKYPELVSMNATPAEPITTVKPQAETPATPADPTPATPTPAQPAPTEKKPAKPRPKKTPTKQPETPAAPKHE